MKNDTLNSMWFPPGLHFIIPKYTDNKYDKTGEAVVLWGGYCPFINAII